MKTINVVNIKCSGCASHIKKELEKAGATKVNVDLEDQKVSFEGDDKRIEETLLKLGYPKAGTKEAESFLKKAISFKSCAIGKFQK